MEKAHHYILLHFVRVATNSTQLIELNFDDFHAITSNDELNVSVRMICKKIVFPVLNFSIFLFL